MALDTGACRDHPSPNGRERNPTPAARDTVEFARRLRQHVVRMTSQGGSSHVGSCLSIADIVAVLYAGVLNVRPDNPRWPGRDRFILSKGHAGACVYAALAERGFF